MDEDDHKTVRASYRGGRPTVLGKIQAPGYRLQRTAVYKYTHGTKATCGRQVGWDEETRDEKTKGRSALVHSSHALVVTSDGTGQMVPCSSSTETDRERERESMYTGLYSAADL